MGEVFRHGVDQVKGGDRHRPRGECVDPKNPDEGGDACCVGGDDSDGVRFLAVLLSEVLCEVVDVEKIIDGEEEFDEEDGYQERRLVLQFLHGGGQHEGSQKFGVEEVKHGC